jgi:integrase
MNETEHVIVTPWCEEYPERELFPSPRFGEKGTSLKTDLRETCKRAGIPVFGARTSGRTFATRLHESERDDMIVAGLLRHRDLRSVHRYKQGAKIKVLAVTKLENRFGIVPNSHQLIEQRGNQ